MKILLIIALLISANVDKPSVNISKKNIEQVNWEEVFQTVNLKSDLSIVMEDMIARVISEDPSDPITAFRVYENGTQLVFEDYSCNTFDCTYDLSQLSPNTYAAEATSASGEYVSKAITIN